MAENPYAPPQAEINAGAPAEIPRPVEKMPGTVIAALVLVILLGVLEILSGVMTNQVPYIRLTISALLVVGFLRGHALAWQWGIVIPILVTILLLVSLGAVYGTRLMGLQALVIAGAGIALYLPIPVLLWFRRSRQYFGLECPKCHEVSTRARSFFFTLRRCNVCKFEWTPVRR